MKTGRAIERDQPHIRSTIANLQVPEMHVRQGEARHLQSIFRAARHQAEPDKKEN